MTRLDEMRCQDPNEFLVIDGLHEPRHLPELGWVHFSIVIAAEKHERQVALTEDRRHREARLAGKINVEKGPVERRIARELDRPPGRAAQRARPRCSLDAPKKCKGP